jgi:nitrite reductase/ring-hydroxylating ferredoxin subunit
MGLRELIHRIEGMDSLDDRADRLSGIVNGVVGPAKSLLSGTWLGHPLHPLLTDVPIGCWTGAVLLDLAGGDDVAAAVDPLVGLGVLAALPTAVSGLSDWADTCGGERRIGLVHAAANGAALGLFTLSLVSSRGGARALRLLGLAAVGAGGYLGGHLSYARGLGVDHQAFIAKPGDWTGAIAAAALDEGVPVPARVGEAPVLLYRRGTQIYAVSDVCPHAGGPLHEGVVDADLCVTCPWHGSRFQLSDGRVVRGPATAPATVYEARVQRGRVQVRPSPELAGRRPPALNAPIAAFHR